MDLFDVAAQRTLADRIPLAERMRPERLDEFVGQQKVLGPGSLLRQAIEADRLFSMILWGPPGCGKTTLARLLARKTKAAFVQFSAVLSGVKEIREVMRQADENRRLHARQTIVFVDEIHRFNKAQQDGFLHQVESGRITLIGATTENPSFEVIAPLLSRCRVIRFHRLAEDQLRLLAQRALSDEERGLGKWQLTVAPQAMDLLVAAADGDGRRLLNNLELAALAAGAHPHSSGQAKEVTVTLAHAEAAVARKALRHDKGGDQHYDLISAFHKSLRGSDPDAALYWLARMLQGGDDPLYLARRMVRFASEDVGNADPWALNVALGAMEAFRFLGSPEGELALAQAAVYLATAPKSNTVYKAWDRVNQKVKQTGTLPVPLHLRNAPTGLMKQMGHGRGYRYPHDHPGGFVAQTYLPAAIEDDLFYFPKQVGYEKTIARRLEHWRRLAQRRRGSKPPSFEQDDQDGGV